METLPHILDGALAAMQGAKPMQGYLCCARAYVCFIGVTPKIRATLKKWAKSRGKIYQTEAAYGMRNALYIGYDNASGIECGKAQAFADYVKAQGVSCFADFGQD